MWEVLEWTLFAKTISNIANSSKTLKKYKNVPT